MRIFIKKTIQLITQYKFVIFALFLGTGLVIQSLGLDFSRMPGDLGDTRFNNYILEHFYKWISHKTRSYWDAPFFYPYPLITAFSDNLLGSAPIFALFRYLGLSRETSFQGWYIFGYILNYLSAVYVLLKIKFSPFASAAGAFFFAFGLPMFAQEGHVQLVYRFCIPLTGLLLWKIPKTPRLNSILLLMFFITWQFFLSIYTGYFLILLLGVMAIVIPALNNPQAPKIHIAKFWPNKLKEAWNKSGINEKIIFFTGMLIIGYSLIWLILPYIRVSNIYNFSRSAEEIELMLPRVQSYFLAINSELWQSNSPIFSNIPMLHEHQLFPGISIYILVIIGILWKFPSENRNFAIINITSVFILVLFTININGLSLYKLILGFPGINSIRAVTRIQLVLMWPLAVFASCVMDTMYKKTSAILNMKIASYFIFSILVIESTLFNHYTYSKKEGQIRISQLRNQITQKMGISNVDPIIYLGPENNDPFYITELDAMLVSQQLDTPTLNGYSGNVLYGFEPASDCVQLPIRILKYMKFINTNDKNVYFDLINRVIPIRLSKCESSWYSVFPENLQMQLEQEE